MLSWRIPDDGLGRSIYFCYCVIASTTTGAWARAAWRVSSLAARGRAGSVSSPEVCLNVALGRYRSSPSSQLCMTAGTGKPARWSYQVGCERAAMVFLGAIGIRRGGEKSPSRRGTRFALCKVCVVQAQGVRYGVCTGIPGREP